MCTVCGPCPATKMVNKAITCANDLSFRKASLGCKRCPCSFLSNPLSCRVIITLFLYGLEFFQVSKTLVLNPWPCVQCCWVLYLYTSLSTKHVCCFLLYASVEYPKSFRSVGAFPFKLFSRCSVFSPTGISYWSTIYMNTAFQPSVSFVFPWESGQMSTF